MSIRNAFDHSHFEPNWAEVERVHSWLYWSERDNSAYAFLDRWGYKAADNRDCNMDYEFMQDWDKAYKEGYMIAPFYDPHRIWTKEDWDAETDPTYGMDSVTHGPYFIDQRDNGHFNFLGPKVYAPGPKPYWDWEPQDYTEEYWYDTSLWFSDLRP